MSDVAMRRTDGDEPPDPNAAPGTFCWRTHGPGDGTPGGRYLLYVCPRSQGYCGVPIAPNHNGDGHGWHHDGNDDAPTLTPSVNCTGGCHWHGFITAGRMTSV